METMFFGVKRMHLCVNEILKKVIWHSTLTPARFDLLRIVAIRGPIRQRAIRSLLGVSGPTVSIMLKGLQEWGTVWRDVDPTDRRHRIIRITPMGEDFLERAYDQAIDSRVGEQMVKTAVAYARLPDLEDAKLQRAVFDVEDFFVKARRMFRDKSMVRNPWTDDDVSSMLQRALEHDTRPPLDFPGRGAPDSRLPFSDEEISKLWDRPPGWIPLPEYSSAILVENYTKSGRLSMRRH